MFTFITCTAPVEYRKVNDVSQFDAYQMPWVDEIQDCLGTARFFTTLDLTKGYWQIPLYPVSEDKTAFLLVPICYASFGLFVAQATFQSPMDRVQHPRAAYAAASFDDVIIHSGSWAKHMQQVARLLDSLRWRGLIANPKKCAIGWGEVWYQGYHLGGRQVHLQVHKTAVIAACPRPKTKKEVRWGSSWVWLAGSFPALWAWPVPWLTSPRRVPQIWSSGAMPAGVWEGQTKSNSWLIVFNLNHDLPKP